MKNKIFLILMVLIIVFSFNNIYAQNATEPGKGDSTSVQQIPAEQQPQVQQPAPQPEKPKAETPPKPTVQLDKNTLNNGGNLKITGTAPPGSEVYIEIWNAEKKVRANFFDNKRDKDGKIPYILYLSEEIPAFYKIIIPEKYKQELENAKKEGKGWKYSELLKKTGADQAYSAPAKVKIDAYQASILAAIIGSRGEKKPPLDEKETRRRSMQLVKSRFRDVDKLFAPNVIVNPDGSFTADVNIRSGVAPGKYNVVVTAVYEKKKEGDKEVVKKVKSDVVSFENKIAFPNVYLPNAGTSLNILWPFILTLFIAIFGVLMGAGGGFILNPLLVTLFPLPHTVVAGTVMPTVLFSQATGIYNYTKINFINWKLGVTIGLFMVLGAFIGPKLTELITLEQFKFIFGWILFVLAGLMFWQTTPGYLEKNKKEQAILKEFKKRAEEAAKKRAQGG